ncbi:MAG: methylenetetrahydrofolate reductase [NAD(P)H], partial [Actinobacteria bacterium]
MRIDEILEERRPVFSFEFFPPKDKQGMTQLKGALAELAQDEPAYVSVT